MSLGAKNKFARLFLCCRGSLGPLLTRLIADPTEGKERKGASAYRSMTTDRLTDAVTPDGCQSGDSFSQSVPGRLVLKKNDLERSRRLGKREESDTLGVSSTDIHTDLSLMAQSARKWRPAVALESRARIMTPCLRTLSLA